MSNPRIRKRTKAQRADQLVEIAEMHQRGRPIREIAERFGLSKSQIQKDLATIYKKLVPDKPLERARLRARLLAKNDLAQKELWAAWDKSKEDKEVQTKEQISSTPALVVEGNEVKPGKGASERMKASLRSEGQCGNPAYIAELGKCWDREAKLLGLNDPKEAELKDIKPIQFIEVVRTVPALPGTDDTPPVESKENGDPAQNIEDVQPTEEHRGGLQFEVVLVENAEKKLKRALGEFAEECARQEFKREAIPDPQPPLPPGALVIKTKLQSP